MINTSIEYLLKKRVHRCTTASARISTGASAITAYSSYTTTCGNNYTMASFEALWAVKLHRKETQTNESVYEDRKILLWRFDPAMIV